MGLTGGAWDSFDDRFPSVRGDDVHVAEDREDRLGPLLEHLPGLVVGRVHRVVRAGWQQLGEGAAPDRQRRVGVRRPVPIDHPVPGLGHHHHREHRPGLPHRRLPCHLLEVGEGAGRLDVLRQRLGRVSVRQARVRDHHATRQPGILRGETHTDDAAPIVQHHVDVGELQGIDEQGSHPLDVAIHRVVVDVGRLVGHAHADEIRSDHPVARFHQPPDLMTPEVGPGRVAVQQHDDRRPLGVGIDHVHPEALPVTGWDLDPTSLVGIVDETIDGVVRTAQNSHRFDHLSEQHALGVRE